MHQTGHDLNLTKEGTRLCCQLFFEVVCIAQGILQHIYAGLCCGTTVHMTSSEVATRITFSDCRGGMFSEIHGDKRIGYNVPFCAMSEVMTKLLSLTGGPDPLLSNKCWSQPGAAV